MVHLDVSMRSVFFSSPDLLLAVVMAKLGMPPVQTVVDTDGRQLFMALGLEKERTLRLADWVWIHSPNAKVDRRQRV